VPVPTVQALVVVRSDCTGFVLAGSPAVRVTGTARVFSGGVTFVNNDPTKSCRIGASNIDGTAPHPGYPLAAAGGTISFGAIDISTLYVYATSGAPEVDWIGVDVA
jgi:hypothetical protein